MTLASLMYGPGDLPIEQITSGGTVSYLHHDQAGSTRLLTGSTGTVTGKCTYSAYGAPTCEGSGTTPLGYDAQYTSSDTGLIYMRARTYDPATAQFLSVDPLAAITGAPYNYASDNPVNEADPTGLGPVEVIVSSCEEEPIACAFLGAAGGTAGVIAGKRASEEVINAMTSGEPTYESDEGEAELKTKEAGRESEESCGEEPPPRRLPYQGEPNGTAVLDRGNGTGQIREYGPDGLPTRDFDFGHDHGSGDPHAHDWPGGVRGDGRPIEPNE
jgi:RHS repeat-associated protein